MQAQRSSQVQWLAFRLSGSEYALAVGDVVEVLSMVALAPLPEAPAWLAGMMNLRGRVMPVMDLRVRLNLPPRPIGPETPIIVAQCADRLVGFIVDEVTEVLSLPTEALAAPDALAGAAHPILAVARAAGRLILLLDLQRICAPARQAVGEGQAADAAAPLHIATWR